MLADGTLTISGRSSLTDVCSRVSDQFGLNQLFDDIKTATIDSWDRLRIGWEHVWAELHGLTAGVVSTRRQRWYHRYLRLISVFIYDELNDCLRICSRNKLTNKVAPLSCFIQDTFSHTHTHRHTQWYGRHTVVRSSDRRHFWTFDAFCFSGRVWSCGLITSWWAPRCARAWLPSQESPEQLQEPTATTSLHLGVLTWQGSLK